MKTITYCQACDIVLSECENALSRVRPEEVNALIDAIENAGQVFFMGIGRVMLALECVAKRMVHLGIQAHVVGEIIEPPIEERDLLIVGSGSGESLCPAAIAQKAKSLGASVAWIGSNEEGTIARLADIRVRIPVKSKLAREDELHSRQPMTSLFEQSLLLLGDAMALMLIERKQLTGNLYMKHANLE